MGRLFGIVLIVLGVWVGAEVFSKGVHGAFGGRLAPLAGAEPEAEPAAPTTERAAQAVERAYDQAEGRLERALGE